jgi:hypothetical protein
METGEEEKEEVEEKPTSRPVGFGRAPLSGGAKRVPAARRE